MTRSTLLVGVPWSRGRPFLMQLCVLHLQVLAAAGADMCARLQDDCIDSGTGMGGTLLISDSYVERCHHEGIALSSQRGPRPNKRVLIERSYRCSACSVCVYVQPRPLRREQGR